MMDIAAFGYLLAAVAFSALLILLRGNRTPNPLKDILTLTACISALWAAALAYRASNLLPLPGFGPLVVALEYVRDLVWLGLLAIALKKSGFKNPLSDLLSHPYFLMLIGILLVGALVVTPEVIGNVGVDFHILTLLAFIILATIGLMFIEQLFRGTQREYRWSIKFLCLGVGGLFAYDFYLYSEALLFKYIDINVWSARGYVNAIAVPFIAISIARNPQWSVDIFVSRKIVLHSATLLGAGLYLVAMALGGYYVRAVGGDWGLVGQIVFLFGALAFLLVLMFSGSMRAWLKVVLNKHFMRSPYDYRDEWVRITNALSSEKMGSPLRERVVQVIAEIVESPGGMLFIHRESGEYCGVGSWNMARPLRDTVSDTDPLVLFLVEKKWVINLDEYERNPALYERLVLPTWLNSLPAPWLIVPLFHHAQVLGFIILARSRADMLINWEIRDLLMTTGRQAASYLALLDANEALLNARQFEAFNRLSAFVVHDLKNLVAQLSLVVSNAARHKNNPAFFDDAMLTVEYAVEKMNRLLAQLRKDRAVSVNARRVSLSEVLTEAIKLHSKVDPIPHFEARGDGFVVTDHDRIVAIIGHLIQNAQEATAKNGFVNVRLIVNREANLKVALICIEDNGCGMDANFLRESLFKPFVTTKGNAGMGIGVYESREFLASMGGRIEVQSQPNKGTQFTITLPLIPEHQVEQVSIHSSSEPHGENQPQTLTHR